MSNAGRGFTLIELLTTVTIIGLLSTIGTVSYGFIRMKARDAKRVADIRTIRNAIEIYFEQNSSYPGAPPQGVILGTEKAKVISDAGITPIGAEKGLTYLLGVPLNVEPGGIPFLYRGRNADGFACVSRCEHYEVTFSLESPTGDFVSGPHKLTDLGIEGPEGGYKGFEPPSFLANYIPGAEDVQVILGSAQEIAATARKNVDRPEVQTANKALVAPAAVVASIANFAAVAATVLPIANLGQFFAIFMLQPLLLLTRRKRQTWGTVYNFNTKVPVDLASVRLIDSATNRPAAVKVTDKDGRYAFTARRGTYRLEVSKPGFAFPSPAAASLTADGRFTDIYHGTLIQVDNDGQSVTVNVPLDPEREPSAEVRELLSIENKKQLRKALALSGPLLGLAALVVTPSIPMLILFLVHLFVYNAFKRMAEPVAVKNQGVVYDEETRDPVGKAVVRILSLPYHKVLETRLTDSKGRYSFYVGNGKYYLTVLKPGFEKTETTEIDFTAIEKPTFIASDLPMRRAAEAGKK